MSARGDHLLKAALDYLRSLGVSDVTVENGKHVHIRFTWNGQRTMVTVARSPGERQAVMIKLNDIRRQLGVKIEPKQGPGHGKGRRAKARPSRFPDSFTVKPDPWLVLKGLL